MTNQKPDGTLELSTSFLGFISLTPQTPKVAKDKAAQIWPEYEAEVEKLQRVIYVPHPQYTIAINEGASPSERNAASKRMEQIRKELKKESGVD